MGLDMYLNKTARVEGYDKVDDYVNAGRTLDFHADMEKEREKGEKSDYTMKEWSGVEQVMSLEEANAFKSSLHEEGVYLKYMTIWTRVNYWRKANHIHNWFVKNVQDGEDDCGTYEVTEDNLKELLEVCKEVMSYKDNPDIEALTELLPTVVGFFFGGTDYDEYYFSDVKDTIDAIEETLKTVDFEKELVVYKSSW